VFFSFPYLLSRFSTPPYFSTLEYMKLTSLLCCTARATLFSEDDLPPRHGANGTGSNASLQSSMAKAPVMKTSTSDGPEVEPYTPNRATALFATYVDEDSSVIGPEGFERLCSDVDVSLDGALPLILAWLLKASEMAKVTKAEWDEGTTALQCVPSLAICLMLTCISVVQDSKPRCFLCCASRFRGSAAYEQGPATAYRESG
jgi:hypothetical protein